MLGNLERVLNARLYFFLHQSGLLHLHQHGFTKGKNTTSALFDLRNRLQDYCDRGYLSLVISLDFSGAFVSIGTRSCCISFVHITLLETFTFSCSISLQTEACGTNRTPVTLPMLLRRAVLKALPLALLYGILTYVTSCPFRCPMKRISRRTPTTPSSLFTDVREDRERC